MYSIKDIYPYFGSVDTTEQTIPEPEEQRQYDQATRERSSQVTPGEKNSIIFGFVLLVGLVVLLQSV